MKTHLFVVLLLTLTNEAFAKCNSNAIGIVHERGFGISFGSGNQSASYQDKNTVNVPITINGEQACFKKTSAFSMKSETKKDRKAENVIVIKPMKSEFENIPSPHQKQYIFVEKNPISKLTKFHTMNFICAGEIPLSIDAVSDSVMAIELKTDPVEVQVSSTFATGAAADNLNRGRNNRTYSQETFDFFTKIYKEKTGLEINQALPCCTDHKVPSIISDTSIRALAGVERAIASTFTTMATDVPNGCSSSFAETMKNYQLENYKQNDSLKDYKVKKKFLSDDLVFEW